MKILTWDTESEQSFISDSSHSSNSSNSNRESCASYIK